MFYYLLAFSHCVVSNWRLLNLFHFLINPELQPWIIILTFKLDLDGVKVNHRQKYLHSMPINIILLKLCISAKVARTYIYLYSPNW